MKTKTDQPHILERPVANAIAPGAIGDKQRRAIWAKRNNPSATAAPPRSMTQTTPFPHSLITVVPTPFPHQLVSKSAPASPLNILVVPKDDRPATTSTPAQPRKWGETRPGEMYAQVEGPGNPSWEKRHPELAPAGGTASPPPTPKPVAPPDNKPAQPPTPAQSRKWGETRPGEMYVQVEGPGNPSWEKKHPELAPSNTNETIRAKIDSLRQTLPAASHAPSNAPASAPAAAPQPRVAAKETKLLAQAIATAKSAPVTTPGHPNRANPQQTPPLIPAKPAGTPVKNSKAKKSYVKNWYRGATTP